jgi:FKBP-type peptidyl-prolyl cis-trans isomerase FkpA
MNYIKTSKYFCSIIFLFLLLTACKNKPVSISETDRQDNASKFVDINRALVKKDQQRILGYIERMNLKMKETGTGLWYEIVNEGTGRFAKKGDLATIEYSVSLLDGTTCYSSKTEGPKTFKIGMGGVESGLEEGILLMTLGSKAKFIMPPHLAHGLPGDGKKIPARAILVYEVGLIELQK